MRKSQNRNPLANHPARNPVADAPRAVLARDQIEDWDDPEIPDRHYPEGTVCTRCGAVYHLDHWDWNNRRRDLLVASGAAHEVFCPACRIVKERLPQGVVTLRGDYWPKHRDDILNLIHNEESRGSSVNPLERIIAIKEGNGELVIETTTEKLGQRIGRAIHSAHKGQIEYQWGHDNQLVRVFWERS